MNEFRMTAIGTIHAGVEGFSIEVLPAYRPALEGLEGFSHIAVFWCFDGCDDEVSRATLQCASPYRASPETLGVFATRSPMRPNPLAMTVAELLGVDENSGILHIAYTDARDQTPVLDIKPYTPSLDRVEHPTVPSWCAHWPGSLEANETFDWSGEFNFE